MTPSEFHTKYQGWGRDVDGVAGIQCVDLFKEFLRIIGCPSYKSPIGGDGYADNIWYNRSRWSQWFTFVPTGQFRDGDIVLFPHRKRGGKTHPLSHICFYYGGQQFGTNQHDAKLGRRACDKPCNWSDALGALRYKYWETTEAMTKNGFTEFKAGGVTCGVYKGKYIGLIVPGKPAQITDMDAPVYILSKAGNDLFEMTGSDANAAGTIYGPYCSIDGKAGQPADATNYLVFQVGKDGKLTHGEWDGKYRDPAGIAYMCSPQAIFSTDGIRYAHYRGSKAYTSSWYQAFVVHFTNGAYGNGVSKGAVQPKYIWQALQSMGADVVAFMDGGSGGVGSAQMLYWDGTKMATYQSSGRAVADITVIYNKAVDSKTAEDAADSGAEDASAAEIAALKAQVEGLAAQIETATKEAEAAKSETQSAKAEAAALEEKIKKIREIVE